MSPLPCSRRPGPAYGGKPVRRKDLLVITGRYMSAAAGAAAGPPEPESPARAGDAAAIPVNSVIKSDLTDESLRAYLGMYISELPGRAAQLRKSLDERNLDLPTLQAHNLQGTGGLYGLMPVTEAAGQLEDMVREGNPFEVITDDVERLIDVLRRVEGSTDADDAGRAASKPAEG